MVKEALKPIITAIEDSSSVSSHPIIGTVSQPPSQQLRSDRKKEPLQEPLVILQRQARGGIQTNSNHL